MREVTRVYFVGKSGPGVTHYTRSPGSWDAATECGRRLPPRPHMGAEWGKGGRVCKGCQSAQLTRRLRVVE